jgi:hypothetical protein
MEIKTQNILLWVLIVFLSIGILVLGYMISNKTSMPQPMMRPGPPGEDVLPELRLSAFMSPDIPPTSSSSNSKSAASSASVGGGPNEAALPVLVGGGDLKQFPKPKSRRAERPKGKPKPKMKIKRRK